MTEVRSGIRHALSSPAIYDLFQRLVGAYAWRRRVIEKFVLGAVAQGGFIIDVGCGTAEILQYLPEAVEYLGFDQNAAYLDRARKRFSRRNARFVCEELSPAFSLHGRRADVILAFGILHHLDDATCGSLLRVARDILAPDGFLLTLDPLYEEGQSPVARHVISRDRGTAVRTERGYRTLAEAAFPSVAVHVDRDPLHIPYTGIVMKCSK